MKKLLVALFLFSLNFTFGQTFEIPSTKQPYFRIIEWKGVGSILMSRDPSFTQSQVGLQLLGMDGKPMWQQGINPMVKEPYFISEDGGKYAYFLENLEPKDGKLFLHQLTPTGNVRTQNLNFLAAIKRLGDFQVNDLETVDIVTTEKALVWLFRYTDKSAEKLYTIAVSMTHHNFTLFAYLVAENVVSKSKVENQIAGILPEKREKTSFLRHASMREKNPDGKFRNFRLKELQFQMKQ